jgi:preprotein translocase subunit SecF
LKFIRVLFGVFCSAGVLLALLLDANSLVSVFEQLGVELNDLIHEIIVTLLGDVLNDELVKDGTQLVSLVQLTSLLNLSLFD